MLSRNVTEYSRSWILFGVGGVLWRWLCGFGSSVYVDRFDGWMIGVLWFFWGLGYLVVWFGGYVGGWFLLFLWLEGVWVFWLFLFVSWLCVDWGVWCLW